MFLQDLECDIDRFLKFLALEKGYSTHTIEGYRRDLRTLFRLAMEVHDMDELVGRIPQMHLHHSVSTQARFLACMKSFFHFLHLERHYPPYADRLHVPKSEQNIPRSLSHAEVEALLSLPAKETFVGARDQAMLEVLYATGIRISELCGLNLLDVDDRSLKVIGKGKKQRMVPLTKRALISVDYFLIHFRDHVQKYSDALFVSQQGERLSRYNAWHRIQVYCQQLGIHASPHVLRHSFASHLLANHADIRVIQSLMGHESITSTERYTQVADDRIRALFDQYHPREEL